MGRNGKNKHDVDKACIYCENAIPLHDRDFMLCQRKGVVGSGFLCRHFSYDPLKRVPVPRRSIREDLPLPELPE
ncbi:MAG: hypothetical protein E7578_02060 [Ruminococcaceae bacterium]|nr:hypothetical protein [Oscillospiraceae bacterium]